MSIQLFISAVSMVLDHCHVTSVRSPSGSPRVAVRSSPTVGFVRRQGHRPSFVQVGHRNGHRDHSSGAGWVRGRNLDTVGILLSLVIQNSSRPPPGSVPWLRRCRRIPRRRRPACRSGCRSRWPRPERRRFRRQPCSRLSSGPSWGHPQTPGAGSMAAAAAAVLRRETAVTVMVTSMVASEAVDGL